MKYIKKLIVLNTILIMLILLFYTNSYAMSIKDTILPTKYSTKFEEYLKLSEEEKKNVPIPLMFDIPIAKYESRNPFKLLKANQLQSQFTLKSVIPNNLKIRNQKNTQECWAFAALSSLETNLALNNGDSKQYDFSERHMDYYTSKTFKDNNINPAGFNREVGAGGNYVIASAYLTNGSGAIFEKDMPFENNENKIDIGEIQNKTVVTQVDDITMFPTYTVETGNTELVKNQIKEYIMKNGSVMAMIYGATLQSEYCNVSTGAIYCDDSEKCPQNHGVSIVGWDDNYSISNFNKSHKPKSNGAWIIRNSWGEKLEITFNEAKKQIWNSSENNATIKQYIQNNNITNYTMISDEYVKEIAEQNGYTVEGNVVTLKVGDNGFMYISYEDVNVYTGLFGIEKSAKKIDYDNIYQHNFYGFCLALKVPGQKAYIGEKFNRDATKTEYLNKISLNTGETCTCKVYVNSNNDSINRSDLQFVRLKEGDSKTVSAGYHTLEFAEPIELENSKFAVVVEIQGTTGNVLQIPIECKSKDINIFDNITLDEGTSFIATTEEKLENNEWIDLSKITEEEPEAANGDATIKAFTTYIDHQDIDIDIPDEPSTPDPDEPSIPNEPSNPNNPSIPDEPSNPNNPSIPDEPSNPEEPSDTEEKTAENSNLNSLKANIISEKNYKYTNEKKNYVIIDTTITGITKNINNDSLEYYYYISTNPDEENINNWLKVSENSNNNDKIQFTINSKDLSNYEELSKASQVYIYIKEIAKSGNSLKESISSAIPFETTNSTVIKNYENDVEITTNNGTVDTTNDENDIEKESKTNKITTDTIEAAEKKSSAPNVLPYTGITSFAVLFVISTTIGVVSFIKYRKYKF